jgi:hypothetical protein
MIHYKKKTYHTQPLPDHNVLFRYLIKTKTKADNKVIELLLQHDKMDFVYKRATIYESFTSHLIKIIENEKMSFQIAKCFA